MAQAVKGQRLAGWRKGGWGERKRRNEVDIEEDNKLRERRSQVPQSNKGVGIAMRTITQLREHEEDAASRKDGGVGMERVRTSRVDHR